MTYTTLFKCSGSKAVEMVSNEACYSVRVIEDRDGAWYPISESRPYTDRKKAEASFKGYVRRYL